MTDKEKIRAEAERLKRKNAYTEYARGYNRALGEILSFIDSMKEEPASEDLEEEIRKVAGDYEQVEVAWNNDFDFIARHFANWQKKQMIKEAIEKRVIRICQKECFNLVGVELTDNPLVKAGDKIKLIIVKKN